MLELATSLPEEVHEIYTRANGYLAKGCLDFAERLYSRLLAIYTQGSPIDPDLLADILHNLGMIAQERQYGNLALSYYLQALEMNEERSMTWLFLAQIYFERFDESHHQADLSSGRTAVLKAEAINGNYPIIKILKQKYAINA